MATTNSQSHYSYADNMNMYNMYHPHSLPPTYYDNSASSYYQNSASYQGYQSYYPQESYAESYYYNNQEQVVQPPTAQPTTPPPKSAKRKAEEDAASIIAAVEERPSTLRADSGNNWQPVVVVLRAGKNPEKFLGNHKRAGKKPLAREQSFQQQFTAPFYVFMIIAIRGRSAAHRLLSLCAPHR